MIGSFDATILFLKTIHLFLEKMTALKQLTTLSFIKFYKTPMSQLKPFSEKAFDKWTMITHLYKKIKSKN